MGGPSGAHDPVTSVRGAVGPSTTTAWQHFPARLRQAGSGGRGLGHLSPSLSFQICEMRTNNNLSYIGLSSSLYEIRAQGRCRIRVNSDA